ncbi:MAG TPA: 50S ribosomal protein L6 [Thermoplasmata archaeon]
MARTGVAEERVKIPEGVQLELRGPEVVVAAKGHTVRRTLSHPRISMALDTGEVRISCTLAGRREKAIVGTFAAHVRNMIEGVMKGFTYRMKIVYSHFPMKASAKGNEFIVENFLGERAPRRTTIIGETKVSVDGDQVTLRGPNVEEVGQTAANIEQLTRIKRLDPRVFQDGIYIVSKGEEA